MTLAHGPRSMWTEEKRVYERVERPSVYPIDWQQQRRVAGLLLGAPQAGDIDLWQALGSECGQCLVSY